MQPPYIIGIRLLDSTIRQYIPLQVMLLPGYRAGSWISQLLFQDYFGNVRHSETAPAKPNMPGVCYLIVF